ncbi:hypothetical protein KP509_16G039900 [Ceratopteris richardii]|uniref:Uncharacterized protein n=1 Tax=Ceratopteris richardii TaxID=49495 RepID=A0A8T2SY74_CERRI|nr:hypothetical protein KP509_16G039900 [Ceratopteris richardii]
MRSWRYLCIFFFSTLATCKKCKRSFFVRISLIYRRLKAPQEISFVLFQISRCY